MFSLKANKKTTWSLRARPIKPGFESASSGARASNTRNSVLKPRVFWEPAASSSSIHSAWSHFFRICLAYLPQHLFPSTLWLFLMLLFPKIQRVLTETGLFFLAQIGLIGFSFDFPQELSTRFLPKFSGFPMEILITFALSETYCAGTHSRVFPLGFYGSHTYLTAQQRKRSSFILRMKKTNLPDKRRVVLVFEESWQDLLAKGVLVLHNEPQSVWFPWNYFREVLVLKGSKQETEKERDKQPILPEQQKLEMKRKESDQLHPKPKILSNLHLWKMERNSKKWVSLRKGQEGIRTSRMSNVLERKLGVPSFLFETSLGEIPMFIEYFL